MFSPWDWGQNKKTLGSLLLDTFLLAAQTAQATVALVTAPLNLRDGSGKNHARRKTIPAGEIVNVRRCLRNCCEINYGPRTGRVSAAFLAVKSGKPIYQNGDNDDGYDRPSQPTYNIIIDNYYNDNGDYCCHRH